MADLNSVDTNSIIAAVSAICAAVTAIANIFLNRKSNQKLDQAQNTRTAIHAEVMNSLAGNPIQKGK